MNAQNPNFACIYCDCFGHNASNNSLRNEEFMDLECEQIVPNKLISNMVDSALSSTIIPTMPKDLEEKNIIGSYYPKRIPFLAMKNL